MPWAAIEVDAGTGIEDRLELFITEDRPWFLGHDRRRHPLHRGGDDLVLPSAHLKNGWRLR